MDSFLTLVFGLVLVAYNLFVLLNKRRQKEAKPAKTRTRPPLPPGPRGLPIVGNLFQVGPHPHRAFVELNRKYGPIVFLRLGSSPTIVTQSPHMIKEILTTQDHVFASRPPTVASEHVSYSYQDVAMCPTGPRWRNNRRMCVSQLLTPKRVESFQGPRREEADNMVRSVWQNFRAGKVTDLQHTLGGFAMNVITRMMVDKSYFKGEATRWEELQVLELIQKSFYLVGRLNISDYLPWLRRFDLQGYEKQIIHTTARLDATYTKILEEHKKARQADPGKEPRDFVDLLLSSSRGAQPAPAPVPDTTIKALIHDMVAAGTDTSAVTIEYIMAELLRNPDMLKRAQDEIDSKVGKQRFVEELDVPDLHYVRCLFKEGLRLHPPGPFLIPHYSVEATQLGGYHIPKGTTVFVNVFGLGRHPDVWDKPEHFIPDRHAHQQSGPDVRDPGYKTLPFGAGRRSCPGAMLGSLMVLLGLARLLHCFDWACPPGRKPQDIDLQEVFGMTMPLRQHLMAIATPRLPEHLYTQIAHT